MEDNNQESISNQFSQQNLNQEYSNSNNILLREPGIETISSENYLDKNEIEIKEIKEEVKKEDIPIQEINTSFDQANESKEYPLITKLLNIQKLINKELSTRKICKYKIIIV